MNIHGRAVVGIDVGGEKKGFHAVALRGGSFEKRASCNPSEISNWCRELGASAVAVDAPCGWSESGSSRKAERELTAEGIYCFATPTCRIANNKSGFYGGILNGKKLYGRLAEAGYKLFDGEGRDCLTCFETSPHAIVCALVGKIVPAKPKNSRRREVLCRLGYDHTHLSNIDFVDAAMCAVTAERFCGGLTRAFGGREEGLIVVPTPDGPLSTA